MEVFRCPSPVSLKVEAVTVFPIVTNTAEISRSSRLMEAKLVTRCLSTKAGSEAPDTWNTALALFPEREASGPLYGKYGINNMCGGSGYR